MIIAILQALALVYYGIYIGSNVRKYFKEGLPRSTKWTMLLVSILSLLCIINLKDYINGI